MERRGSSGNREDKPYRNENTYSGTGTQCLKRDGIEKNRNTLDGKEWHDRGTKTMQRAMGGGGWAIKLYGKERHLKERNNAAGNKI
jgi:hypothetical protein